MHGFGATKRWRVGGGAPRGNPLRAFRRRVRRRGARVRDPRLFCARLRLDVEVVEDLDVVAQKSDRAEDDVGRLLPRDVEKTRADVGPEPRIAGHTWPVVNDTTWHLETGASHPGVLRLAH